MSQATDEVDRVYHTLVEALPDGVATIAVVAALGMLLSTVIIEYSKGKESRTKLAEAIAKRIIDSCKHVPSGDELAAGIQPTIPDEYQTRH